MKPDAMMPMKRICKLPNLPVLVLTALSAGVAVAGTVKYNDTESVIIKFAEPVVSMGVVENGWKADLSAEDRGLTLFDITGDPQHTPSARWLDQDSLELRFVKGTSAATRYRLAFHPGADKYLSGKTMKKSAFEFSVAPSRLVSRPLLPGISGGAVNVGFVSVPKTLEQLNFSPSSAVRYEFREVKNQNKRSVEYGKSVPAKVVPTQVKHLPPHALSSLLTSLETLGLSEGEQGLAAFSPELKLPGNVLVLPTEPLDTDKNWVLYAEAAENSGFESGQVGGLVTVESDLRSGVNVHILVSEDKSHRMQVGVHFAAPVAEKDVENIFRQMDICAGEVHAVPSEDGLSKTLSIGGQNITFRLCPLPDNRIEAYGSYRRGGSLGSYGNVAYDLPYTNEFRIDIEGVETLPETVDFRLKAGTTALLGQTMVTDHCHRLSLMPAAPALSLSHTPDSPALLPLKGDHTLRVECLNNSRMSVSVAHFTAEQYVAHRNRLEKINESYIQSHARLVYMLQLLQQRVQAGLMKEKDAAEQVKSYRRQIARQKSELPQYQALRAELSDISFTEPQVFDTTGQGDGTLKSAVQTLDLDAMLGAPAGPGFYLIAVRTESAPNVRSALRELGLEETLFDYETWYAVHLTDLNILKVNNALVLNHLSDGSPVQEASLLSTTGAEELAKLENGAVLLPNLSKSSRRRSVLLLKSGADYRIHRADYDAPRMNADRRIMVLKDRSLYRPGEKVHLRGVLREVSHLGEPSMPHVKSVEIIVSRPNRKEMLRKKISLNDFGAFDFSFDLPKGDEDIVGTYRVTIQADGNKYRDEEFVECQEFRRDAFEAKAKLQLAPVRADSFTYTVEAADLNGVPLSGAKAELTFSFDDARREPSGWDCQVAPPHFKDKEWTETLTLDAAGKATYTGQLEYLHREALMHGYGRLYVRGHVVNDREERIVLNDENATTAPADFRVLWRGMDHMTLYAISNEAKAKAGVLQRDQPVSLRLYLLRKKEQVLPNGVILIHPETHSVWEGELTVPAGSVNGVPTGIREQLRTYLEQQPAGQNGMPDKLLIELRGKDPAGRELQEWNQVFSWEISREEREKSTHRTAQCQVNGRSVQLSSTFENAGRAVVLLNSVGGPRAAAMVEVKKGANTWEIPLKDTEYGDVNLAVLLPVEKDGSFSGLEFATSSAEVERVQTKLTVELNMPQEHPAPGSNVTLTGRVLGPDGQPVPATQVTLFAVDQGMLSVSGGHHVPNPGTFFTKVWVSGMHPQFMQTPAPLVYRFGETLPQLLPGIWRGDLVGAGAALPAGEAGMNGTAVTEDGCFGVYENAVEEPADADFAMAREVAAPVAAESAMLGDGMGMSKSALKVKRKTGALDAAAPQMATDAAVAAGGSAAPAPRLRTNFVPLAVWAPALPTDAEGCFSVSAALPDTLTTYQVYAVVLGADGKCFGKAENEFTVSQPVMLTPGTPLFMSIGDRLRLPLTITNNTENDATWSVTLEGADAPQQIALKAKSTATLYFDYTAVQEGERKLRWQAVASAGSDAVEGCFEVRFPAPVLREAHRLVLQEGADPLRLGSLPAPELAGSTRGSVEVELSANPLVHLNECMELTLSRGYGHTEYYATSLLPWMLHERMAPFSPVMASVPAAEARQTVTKGIERLVKCQLRDGGMSYWPDSGFCHNRESSPWASAYAGLVLTIARDAGFEVPAATLERLRGYLSGYLAEMRKEEEVWDAMSPHILYAAGRTLEDEALITEALNRAIAQQTAQQQQVGVLHPRACCYHWFRSGRASASLNFLAEMHRDKDARHESFLKWMRSVGHDYRHATSWDGGWMLIALHEYLRLSPAGNPQSTLALEDSRSLTLGNGLTVYHPAQTPTLGELATTFTPTAGTSYINVKFKALPEQTNYPGVTEKGLQVTRIYEKRAEDGAWRPATEFRVGDVVRVTLTCAKADQDLEYFVLEDYLPSNLEAINPRIPSQAAGLEWQPWSHWFDNREFQAHRVRGFCTRWGGRDLLNMSYYARVKHVGEAMAPPASAQLMYEPQTYGLSPNTTIRSQQAAE